MDKNVNTRVMCLIVVPLLLAFGAPVALAQLPTATVLGVVKDATGAVVPEATLTARNTDTGQTRSAVSAANGSYRFSALPVGNYEIRVEHSGFRPELRRGLTLAVSQEAVVNLILELGAIEQTVEVTAEAPLVNTTSGSLGGTVDAQKMADLPLNGRNYVNLTLLQTGVSEHKSVTRSAVGTWYSSSGAPVYSNNYLLDGTPLRNRDGANAASSSGSTLGVDGIREYRVVTNSFSAEYGMAMGSQMLLVSKGGTNTFRGSLFEYLRNSALDARNFFDYKTAISPQRLPPFRRNNFGGSFGGPIRKDKTFFFGVYEGLRERLGTTTLGKTIPLAARVDGGVVPQISPVIKAWLGLFPEPNLPGDQFTFPFSRPTRDDYGQMRADHTFSTRDSMFVRYTIDDSERIESRAYPGFTQGAASRSQYATLAGDHVFSPALLNTVRFSFARTNFIPEQQLLGDGLIGPAFSFVPGRVMGNIQIGGITDFGPGGQGFGADGTALEVSKQNVFTWSDDLFYARGRHTLKMGTLINRFQLYNLADSTALGTVEFSNLNDFLLGFGSRFAALTPGSITDRTFHFTTFGFYLQDDLRVRSNLTLNLGLRYEFMTTAKEVHGHFAALRDVHHDAETTVAPEAFKNSSLKNFSPRFGFAWDVMGDARTAVRGGFGLLYDLGNTGTILGRGAAAMPPFSGRSDIRGRLPVTLPFFFPPEAAGKTLRLLDYFLQQPHMLQYNLTVERQLPGDLAVTLAYGGSRGINLLQAKTANASIPQILPDGRQFWTGNDPRPNPHWGAIDLRTAGGNSWYNSLQFGLTKRLSKGLQFQSSYTWSKVIDETQGQRGSSDDTSYGGKPADSNNRKVDRGLASFDIPHNWRFNAIYRLPEARSAGALAKVLNGWWVSSIVSVQSGYPFTPGLTANRSRTRHDTSGLDRPDLLLGRKTSNIVSGTTAGCLGVQPGRQLGTPNLYFDPCAFAIQPIGFLGTAGRSILRGPGFANLDFSVVKETPMSFLGESGHLQFRAEFFNLLNRVNFGFPARFVFAGSRDVEPPLSTAGQITTTVGTSRQIQLALKIVF